VDTTFIKLLIFGLLAALANILGGLVLSPKAFHKRYNRWLKYLLALGAGFMLAVTFIEILPRSMEEWQRQAGSSSASLLGPMLLVLAGYLITQFFEHTVAPHLHLGGEMHCDDHDHEMILPRTAYTAVAGLLIHTFFDGVSIAAASEIDMRTGTLVFIAVFLHKFPEGFTIGSMITAAGKGMREVLAATSLIGVVTLIGVIAFYLAGPAAGFSVAYALPFAGGIALYVSASDLIPEVNHHGGKNPLVSLSVFAGVALFFMTHQLLHATME